MRQIISLLVLLTIQYAYGVSLADLTYVNGCRLFNLEGKNFKNFPGALCLFLDDGRLISANEHAIRMFNPGNEMAWEIKGHFHHQINFSNDKSKIIALSSQVTGTDEDKLREDKIMVIDLKGNVLHETLSGQVFKQTKTPSIDFLLDPHLRMLFGIGKENSHFNSVYEIPANKKESSLSYLKKGNIIVNGLESGIHILSPDLKTVHKHILLKASLKHTVHDVQVNLRGNIVLFNNAVNNGIKRDFSHPNWRAYDGIHSSVMEVDPETQKTAVKFESNPPQVFYSKACGSVQEIGEDIWLFTHMLNATYIYSKKTGKILHSLPATHLNDHQFYPVQQVKAQDLKSFLKFWN